MNSDDILIRSHYRVVRTARGHAAVRGDLRMLPRRLRVLLLAVDSTQTVELYLQTLRGFGDVAALISELIKLNLLELQLPKPRTLSTASASANGSAAASASEDSDSAFSSLPSDMQNQRFLDTGQLESDSVMSALYDSTYLGGLESLTGLTVTELADIPELTERVSQHAASADQPAARANVPDAAPSLSPQTAPAFTSSPASSPQANDISQEMQSEQIRSLFSLLDQTRNDRHRLQSKLGKYRALHDKVLDLQSENDMLRQRSKFLGRSVLALLAVLVVGGVWAAVRF
jgi:hypothetical protein